MSLFTLSCFNFNYFWLLPCHQWPPAPPPLYTQSFTTNFHSLSSLPVTTIRSSTTSKMEAGQEREGKSLAETPTWAFATVIIIMVTVGLGIHGSIKSFGKWLGRTKRKSLLAALDKIKDELMLFGMLSLLMGHWIVFIAKICVKSSAFGTRFYPCAVVNGGGDIVLQKHFSLSGHSFSNYSVSRQLQNTERNEYCPEGSESFASQGSLEQLHRFLFVLGITHICYSFFAIAMAMIKIYSWRIWENQAKAMALQELEGSSDAAANSFRFRRLATFIYQRTRHRWSEHKVLVWLVCFGRQFWSSINRADYMALRLGFITTHQLPLSYDFHHYMLRSMEEEFRDIVGISVPLWIFTIACILLNIHGTNLYFWMSFFPAILILLVGTKLHRIVVRLAVETMDASQWSGFHHFNLRDELFWLGKPRLLLRIIQLVSFQNALEMATFIWSLWEVKEPSCFMQDRGSMVIRLTFGYYWVVSQFWCSFITFPLYVIVTQMGSRFKKSIISENVRHSLHGWRRRARKKYGPSSTHLTATTSTTSLDSMVDDDIERTNTFTFSSMEESSSRYDMDHGLTHQISETEKHNWFDSDDKRNT